MIRPFERSFTDRFVQMFADGRESDIDHQKEQQKDQRASPLSLPTGRCDLIGKINQIRSNHIGERKAEQKPDSGKEFPHDSATNTGEGKNGKNENNNNVKLIATPKLDALTEEVEFIMDLNESIIIWCRFLFTIDMISKILTKKNISHITMTGRDKDKTSKWRTFQSTKVPIFIGQVEAGGIGIELFKENTSDEYQHTIFMENTFILDHREQATARSYGRIGQKAKSRVVDIIIKDTIDVRIMTALKENKNIADLIMEKGLIDFIK